MFHFISNVNKRNDLISINCILQRNYWNQPSLEYVKTKSAVPNIAAKKCRFITPRNAIPALQVSLQYNVSNFESFFLLLVHTAMAHSGCPNVKLSDCVYRHEECIGFLVKRSYTESHVNKTLLKNFIRWKLTTLKNKLKNDDELIMKTNANEKHIIMSRWLRNLMSRLAKVVFQKVCVTLKVFFYQRTSSIKGHRQSKVVFHQRSSSIHQRLFSINGCLPTKV